MPPKAYIMLGRNGDVINLLPALQYEYEQTGEKPKMVVAKEYAGLLDGCSYVEKIIWREHFSECNRAYQQMQNKLSDHEIINCAVYGNKYRIERLCSSFLRESWRLSKCPIPWGRLPLTFDNRSPEREKKLINSLNLNDKPVILTALAGHSSPLSYGEKLLQYLKKQLKDFQVIDISSLRAERMYDLIGLFEKAHSLVAIDSAPLHLSHAVPSLPVISLIVDGKTSWFRSSWRPQHIMRLLYSEAENKFDEIVEAAKLGWNYNRPRIHLVTSYTLNGVPPVTKKRVRFAQNTWTDEVEYTGLVQINTFSGNDKSRNAKNIGDPVNLPFVKDMLNSVSEKADDNDILMIINSDVAIVPGIAGEIIDKTGRHGACYTHRWDLQRFPEKPLILESQLKGAKWYPGSDMFAFKNWWWKKNREIFPDMVFGREAWDMVMRNLIKRSGGTEIHTVIYHEKHPSFWEAKGNAGGNNHNRKLAKEWLNKYGGDWNDWKFKKKELGYK